MNEKDVMGIFGVIAQEMREGDAVNVTVTVRDGKHRVNLTHAPSWIVDQLVESGFFASVKFGTISITAEEE